MTKNILAKSLRAASLQSAKKSAGSSCFYWLYQPKTPKALASIVKK
ncbi:MAG: cyclic lactone autoinducer peptide [Ruminococcus sp.]|nr:cyclic lactone autoinducer peptide [Ruminococcus sp.]